MKKQYFISLLGIAAISIPLGSSLSTFNLQQITPAYEDKELDTGITIDEKSYVKVLDNDYSGGVSANDQIDEIYFKTSFEMPNSPEFQVVNPNETGLNIYEEKEVYPNGNEEDPAEEAEALYSVRYSSLGSLNSSENDGELIININSTNDPNFWIWSLLLSDDSENLIVTAEGIDLINTSKAPDTLIESKIGEVQVNPSIFELDSKIEVTSINGEVLTTKDTASVYYRVTLGTDAEGKLLQLTGLDWKQNNGSFEITINNEEYNSLSIPTEGLITATDLEEAGQATTSYNNTKLVATMSKGSPIEVEVNDFSTIGDPEFSEISAINIDDKHGILEVQGSVISNGVKINNINLIDIRSNTIVGTEEINSKDQEINFSVSAENYSGHLINYELQMTYQVNGKEATPITKVLPGPEKDYPDIINDKKLTSLGIGVISGIIIAILFIIAIITATIFYLYKKVNKNDIR